MKNLDIETQPLISNTKEKQMVLVGMVEVFTWNGVIHVSSYRHKMHHYQPTENFSISIRKREGLDSFRLSSFFIHYLSHFEDQSQTLILLGGHCHAIL